MTLLLALAAGVRNLPWQVWAVAAAVLLIGLYGCQQYESGRSEAVSTITRSNEQAKEKADAASRHVEDCPGVWDRARGVCLSDGPGR
ncbi:hypothetical protein [Bosea sp. (in: a-proteobacteria)]|uniref:hypothetical protein n=1 Tax=Bosea sp. (in: a-proteobacteria) TaxID=1871050 RepID=UPI003B3AD82B